ncbi:hypothetical protein T01_14138 [Trichinella spiralis]|uniref:Uncharacterized protein n=1 Tax=Trichinella spiralis TaxID=6334 RepID=A0A0V1ATU9_TRISP|nr:hypothetical protein T01_14138 [Trichinella spiralis]
MISAYFYILEYGNDVKMMGMQRRLLQDNIVHLCTDTSVGTNQHGSLLYNFPGIDYSLECVVNKFINIQLNEIMCEFSIKKENASLQVG